MPTIEGSDIRQVIVACEAGMGSSVLLTSQLAKQLSPHGVKVSHSPVNRLSDNDADVVLCHEGLVGRARQAAPDTVVIPFKLFMGDPAFAALETAIREGGTLDG